jgi:hypothetical protein
MGMTDGAYLTDGAGLFRIARASRNELLLEDCMHPDLPLVTVTAKELREEGWESRQARLRR